MRRPTTGSRRCSVLAMAIAMTAALGACAPARLAVPEPLASAPRLSVHGRQGDQRSPTLQFGPWRVSDVRRSWVRGSGLDVRGGAIGIDLDRATQRYTFRATEERAGTWEGDCRSAYRRNGVVLPLGTLATDEQARLECRFTPVSGASWTLVTRQRFARLPEGVLVAGEDTLRVRGLDRLVGAVSTRGLLFGWLLLAGEGPVAAVELPNGGAVWIDTPPNAPYRRALGAVAAALLLQEDLREGLERTPQD